MLHQGIIVVIFIFAIGYSYVLPNHNDDNYQDEDSCVRIKDGIVCGTKLKTRSGRIISAFKGIPYAKPPIGDLRFADPKPIEPWNNVLNAIEDAPQCAQKNYLIANPQLEGQEDCLYLNVYTPQELTVNTIAKKRYPVMVYIHGGGWFSGSGASFLHGPEYILDENVILVTLNYRLGIFGFLSTGDDAATGNWAFKDMTLALKWVQDNIDKFGGDRECVTIFGQSAGAASVQYLMLSPRTKGLFHRAISQSGSALDLWATPINSIDVAKAQAQFVDCQINGTNVELVDCLRNVPVEKLLHSGDKFKFWSIDPLTVYLPTVEQKTNENQDPFLPDMPAKLIKDGNYHPNVPYMIGVMANEGIIRAAPISTQSHLRDDLNARWSELGPQLFAIAQSVPQNLISELWENMTRFYMDKEPFVNSSDARSIQNFVNMYSDRAFVYGVYQTAKQYAQRGKQDIYFYKIDYAGAYSWSGIFAASNQTLNFIFNKSHCDDLIYLFKSPALFPDFPEDSSDLQMSKQLVKMWTTFAKEGKHHPNSWKPLEKGDQDNFQYLNIEGPNKMAMKSDFLTNRMEFWEKLDISENR